MIYPGQLRARLPHYSARKVNWSHCESRLNHDYWKICWRRWRGWHFPVNPQLYHRPAQVTVEFPAYAARVDEVRDMLDRHGFSPASLEVSEGLELAST